MIKYKYTVEQLKKAVKESFSMRQTAITLGVNPKGGGGYRRMKRLIEDNKISTSHFDRNANNIKIKDKIPLEKIMIKNSTYTNISRLKKRIVEDGQLEYKCSECSVKDEWNKKPISLHLDHINGVSNDHRLENLRFLCPNCHSQTDTYAGKNKRIKKLLKCPVCKEKNRPEDREFCSKECYHESMKGIPKKKIRKVVRPSKSKLLKELRESNFSAVGRKYNVSDNAVRKWFNGYGLNKNDL